MSDNGNGDGGNAEGTGSDQPGGEGNSSDQQGKPSGDGGFKPITSQDEFNAAVADRVARVRNQFKDYSDLRAKAARLDDIEQASKSEMEKAIDRVAKAEADVATIPQQVTDQLRAHLVDLHKIDKDDADLFLTGRDPETLLKQVHRLTAQQGKRGNFVAREGANGKAKTTDEREAARQLFGGN